MLHVLKVGYFKYFYVAINYFQILRQTSTIMKTYFVLVNPLSHFDG